MSLKFTEELCVVKMKNDAKYEEDLTCKFKIDMRNLTNLDPSTQNLKNLRLNGLLSTKVSAKKSKTSELKTSDLKKVPRSYV